MQIINLIILISSVLSLISVIGVYKFPDRYSRLHASGIIDGAVMILCLLALAFKTYNTPLISLKIMLILLMVLIFNPIYTHLIIKIFYKYDEKNKWK